MSSRRFVLYVLDLRSSRGTRDCSLRKRDTKDSRLKNKKKGSATYSRAVSTLSDSLFFDFGTLAESRTAITHVRSEHFPQGISRLPATSYDCLAATEPDDCTKPW